MDGASPDRDASLSPTLRLARRLIALRARPAPPEAATVAKQCLLDWLGVTLAALIIESTASIGGVGIFGLNAGRP